jgi:multidrug efflux system outer membrane protein
LVAPIYAPELDAEIAVATAEQKIALASYGAAMLGAFEEVETALANEARFAERERLLELAVENYRETYTLTRTRYDSGLADLLEVNEMHERLVAAQVGLARIRDERLALRVDLHLALGGSFEEATFDESKEATDQ